MSKYLILTLAAGAALAIGIAAWPAYEPHDTGSSLADSRAGFAAPPSAPQRQDELSTASFPEDDSAATTANALELSPERRCLALAEHDPRRALEMASAAHLFDANASLLENLAAQWAARDLGAALAWARRQESGERRDDLFARLAFVASKSEPAAAANLVLDEIAPGPKQDEAAISVLHQWALRDFAAAAAWAAKFPASGLFERASAELEGIRRSSDAATREQ